ncbi:MAG: MBL fold metallo-hydrolase [Muribaculaceae bacterium]|nr:MBL fold metallo-hydrolase [Muribaculaceae bacterium]
MKLTFLGTGTSTGVPQIGCNCAVCTSPDSREKRLRASVLVEVRPDCHLLIDCGPDFREQMLRIGSPSLNAVLLTHSHYDHVGGIDDLRPYCYPDSFPVYCQSDVAQDLRERVPYCFSEHLYPGVPTFNIHIIKPNEDFTVDNVRVTPLPVMHARLPIVCFRIGNLAYITDCLEMPAETLEKIKGVDTLVINALRRTPHMSHMNLEQALEVIKAAAPRKAYLTHLSHDMGLIDDTTPLLPDHVHIATDGLSITIP